VRARFIRNTTAGVALGNFNALDIWIWHSLFEDCAVGITNNPGAGNLPGAMVYSGTGTGRLQGDMFDGYPWALGPRLGVVWSAGRGMVVRASGGRIFSAVKTTGGSTHFDGFILNTNYGSADNSINDFFTTASARSTSCDGRCCASTANRGENRTCGVFGRSGVCDEIAPRQRVARIKPVAMTTVSTRG